MIPIPDRQTLMNSRWLRPFAHWLGSPRLWRMNRRSVALGAGLGLFFGILIPFGQILLAVLAAVPLRANLAVAALATLVTNPLTFPAVYWAALRYGEWLMSLSGSADAVSWQWLQGLGSWALPESAGAWLAVKGPAFALGLPALAVTTALLSMGVVYMAWVPLRRVWGRSGSSPRA